MKLTGKKFLLLILYTPSNKGEYCQPIHGRTRLMKMGFIFDKEIRPEFEKERYFESIELPEYFAWKYGPFSTGILNDLEFLVNQKYININKSNDTPNLAELEEYRYWVEDLSMADFEEYEEELFCLTTDKGKFKAIEIWNSIPVNGQSILMEFKTILNNARLDRILEYVYRKYRKDGFTDKSLIKERFF